MLVSMLPRALCIPKGSTQIQFMSFKGSPGIPLGVTIPLTGRYKQGPIKRGPINGAPIVHEPSGALATLYIIQDAIS